MNNFCEDIYLWFDLGGSEFRPGFIVFNCELLVWIVGILGNLMNLVIFRHKNMGRRPINIIFWWLSVSDLLGLAILVLYQWKCEWCHSIEIIFIRRFRNNIYDCVLFLICTYLIQVINTIIIGLNIVLVFCQYMVVAHPLMNEKSLFNRQSIKLAIIWIYILSFVLYLPSLYIYEYSYDTVQSGLNSTTVLWMIALKGQAVNDPDPSSISNDPLVNMYILFFGIILRIGPLIILIILCTLLFFELRNTLRYRQKLGMQAHHLSNSRRNINRMNVTIAVIITMFLITELPLTLSCYSFLKWRNVISECVTVIEYVVLLPFILFRCSYNTFLYLFRIRKYKETLKMLISKSNGVSSRTWVTEQTEL